MNRKECIKCRHWRIVFRARVRMHQGAYSDQTDTADGRAYNPTGQEK